jgi:D-alanine-D-alanine ligase
MTMAGNNFAKVAVLYGGNSTEREVSLRSGAAVLAGLQRAGINAHGIDTKDYPLGQLVADGFSHAFIALHGRGGEDGTIQGALEFLGIPYTGSGVLGSALGMDKVRCKQIWQSLGLPTAPYVRVAKNEYNPELAQEMLDSLGGCVIVKPALEGSSVGMSKATCARELVVAIDEALKYDDDILIEQWITGAEYTVAILGDRALPSIHMETPHSFYDYDAKYLSNSTQYFCPSDLDEARESQIRELALQAFRAVDCQGWGRVDLMADEAGQFYLLEVNTAPGMTQKSLVPMASKAIGLSFDELVVQILKQADKR